MKDRQEHSKRKMKYPWRPERCESCKHPFTENGWESDYSMSGEQVWICSKCQHPNYPRLD